MEDSVKVVEDAVVVEVKVVEVSVAVVVVSMQNPQVVSQTPGFGQVGQKMELQCASKSLQTCVWSGCVQQPASAATEH